MSEERPNRMDVRGESPSDRPVMVITRGQLEAGYIAVFQVGWPLMPMIAPRANYKVIKELEDGTFLVEDPTP